MNVCERVCVWVCKMMQRGRKMLLHQQVQRNLRLMISRVDEGETSCLVNGAKKRKKKITTLRKNKYSSVLCFLLFKCDTFVLCSDFHFDTVSSFIVQGICCHRTLRSSLLHLASSSSSKLSDHPSLFYRPLMGHQAVISWWKNVPMMQSSSAPLTDWCEAHEMHCQSRYHFKSIQCRNSGQQLSSKYSRE